jgi:hypothetical protein
MKKILIYLLMGICCTLQAVETEKDQAKDLKKETIETPEEKEMREFKEFKEFKRRNENKTNEVSKPEEPANKSKEWYISFQGTAGISATEFEKGKASSGKIGFEYRPNPMFGIGFGISNTNLSLTSRDTSSGPLLALLLFNAPYTTTSESARQSAQSTRLLLGLILATPLTYEYKYS